MNDIIKKVLSEGTTPIMSDEGISKAFEQAMKFVFKEGNTTDISRALTLSDDKKPIDTNESMDTTKLDVSVIWMNILAIQNKIYNSKGSTLEEKLSNYNATLAKKLPIDELRNLLMLKNPNEAYKYYQSNHTRTMGKGWIEFDTGAVIGREQDLLYVQQQHSKCKHEYDYRIYLNAPNGANRLRFLELYIKKCIERDIPYTMKGIYETGIERKDRTVLYCYKEYLSETIEILEEIKTENPELIESFGSPITSALNYSYYGISHGGSQSFSIFGKPLFTYNDFVNLVMKLSAISTYAEMIKANKGIYDTLTETDKAELEKYITLDFGFSNVGELEIFIKNTNENVQFIRDIIQSNVEYFKGCATPAEIQTKFKRKIGLWSSLLNFGDLEHKDEPMAFNKEFYEFFGIETAKSIKDEKTKTQFTKTKDGQDKREKIVWPRERVKKIFSANALSTIRVIAMQAGYTSADTAGKTEREIRTMIFDRITLDNESMITILRGGPFNLRSALIGYGIALEDVVGKSKEELQRMYIEKVGLDEIIAAREDVIKKDKISGIERTHPYEGTLQAMRMERGKTILESEEFKSLKTKEEKRSFLSKLSATEREDVKRYYTNYKNAQNISEETPFSL